MTIEKKINYEEGVKKAQILADLKRRYEKAKEGGFKGNIREFILKEKYENILNRSGYARGGNGKPNGVTTLTLDDWLESVDPGGWATEEEDKLSKLKNKFNKLVAFKYGATSQEEEDLVGGHIDDWMNGISKGDLDPSTSFMQYLDMIMGRQGVYRGGIASVVPTS